LGHHWADCEAEFEGAHINVKEMWAAFSAARRWAHLWDDCTIVMVTDNTCVMHAINSGRSKSPEIMSLLRRLFWLSTAHNFEVGSCYIKSGDNIICDAISRLSEEGSSDRIRVADRLGLLCCRDVLYS